MSLIDATQSSIQNVIASRGNSVTSISALSPSSPDGSFSIVLNKVAGTATIYVKVNGVWVPQSGGSGSSVWGSITGTLSNQTDLQNALNLKANLFSPALTGTPTAPTATVGTNTTQVATTAFVLANSLVKTLTSGRIFVGNASSIPTEVALSGDATISNTGVITVGAGAITGAKIASATITGSNIVSGTITGTQIASNIALAGSPTTTTQVAGTNNTTVATTAFVNSQIKASTAFNASYIYVDTANGLDTNLGTILNPFQSINHALTVANLTACTIYFKGSAGTLTLSAIPESLTIFGASDFTRTSISTISITATSGTIKFVNLSISAFTCNTNAYLQNCSIVASVTMTSNNNKVIFDNVNYGADYPIQAGETPTNAPFHGTAATFTLLNGTGTGFLQIFPNCLGPNLNYLAGVNIGTQWIVQDKIAFENSSINSSTGTLGSDGLLDAENFSKLLWSTSLMIMSDGSINADGSLNPAGGNLTLVKDLLASAPDTTDIINKIGDKIANSNIAVTLGDQLPFNPNYFTYNGGVTGVPTFDPNILAQGNITTNGASKTFRYYVLLPKLTMLTSRIENTYYPEVCFLPDLTSNPNKTSFDYDKDIYTISNRVSSEAPLIILTTGRQLNKPNITGGGAIPMLNDEGNPVSFIALLPNNSITLRWSDSRQQWEAS